MTGMEGKTKRVEVEVDVEHATLTETWRLEVPAGLEGQELDDYCLDHLQDGEFVEQTAGNETGRTVADVHELEEVES